MRAAVESIWQIEVFIFFLFLFMLSLFDCHLFYATLIEWLCMNTCSCEHIQACVVNICIRIYMKKTSTKHPKHLCRECDLVLSNTKHEPVVISNPKQGRTDQALCFLCVCLCVSDTWYSQDLEPWMLQKHRAISGCRTVRKDRRNTLFFI